jgi:F-type H+-transporting ATPase subunit epsilon
MSFDLLIGTPDRTFFEGRADSIVVPGLAGYFGVLSRHAAMLSAIGMGVLKVNADGAQKLFVMNGGAAEVTPDRVFVFAEKMLEAADLGDAEEKLAELEAARAPNATR